MFEIEYGGELNLPYVYETIKKVIDLFELNGLKINNPLNTKIRLTTGNSAVTHYTREYINLAPNAPAYYMDQIVFQFAHELTHFVSHRYKLPAKIYWFDEILAANIGLLTLRKLGAMKYFCLTLSDVRVLPSMEAYLAYIKSHLSVFETDGTLVYKEPHKLDALFLNFFEPWTLLSIFKKHVFELDANENIEMSKIFKAMLSDTQPDSNEFKFLTLTQSILYPA